MSDKFTLVYPGNVPLSDTQAACKTTQQDNTANLTGLKPALHKATNGTKTKVNVADFDKDDDGDILNIFVDLRLVDVSTAAGAADAAALAGTHQFRFRCKVHIQDALKEVEVYGKKP